MTDEDEDTTDRMERANRIREMREGRRATNGDGDADVSDTDATDDTDASDDADASDASDATDDTVSEGSEGDDAGAIAEATHEDGLAGEPETAGATADESESTPTIDETVDPAPEDDEEPPEAAEGHAREFDDAGNGTETGETSGFEFEAPATEPGPRSDADAAAETHDDGTDSEAEAVEAEDVAERTTPQSGVADAVSSSDAAAAVDALSSGGTFAIPDQATTVSEDDEQSMLNAEGAVSGARTSTAGRRAAHAGERTRVLEFELGEERFCLDIEYIEEIVELENMTRVPNSPSYVEGVVDLRGQVTTLINPKDALAVEDDGRGDLIVVFDSEEMDEQGHLGWVVDEVRQVTPVTDEEVNESPDEDDEHINGIINRDDEDDFIVWTTPDLALHSSS